MREGGGGREREERQDVNLDNLLTFPSRGEDKRKGGPLLDNIKQR